MFICWQIWSQSFLWNAQSINECNAAVNLLGKTTTTRGVSKTWPGWVHGTNHIIPILSGCLWWTQSQQSTHAAYWKLCWGLCYVQFMIISSFFCATLVFPFRSPLHLTLLYLPMLLHAFVASVFKFKRNTAMWVKNIFRRQTVWLDFVRWVGRCVLVFVELELTIPRSWCTQFLSQLCNNTIWEINLKDHLLFTITNH